MSPATLPRLFRTVRHLHPSQVLWRFRLLAERRFGTPRPVDPDPARVEAALAEGEPPAVPLFHRTATEGPAIVEQLRAGRFVHLHREVELGRDRPDWLLGPVASERLWAITLHYHEWAFALAEVAAGEGPEAAEAESLLVHYLSDWVHRADLRRPGARDLAWNSFSIATRLGWWVRIRARMRGKRPGPWREFEPLFARSFWQQADWLDRHLEWDLRGNHLLRDLAGLAWAGRFFDGPQAARWTATAEALVGEQLAEQLLPDGSHFELSPTYHIHVMEDLYALALLLRQRDAIERLQAALARMAGYLAWMRHPDGRVPLFNDGGMHALCEPSRMLQLCRELGLPAEAEPVGGRHFVDAGMVVWHGNPWSLFFDVGRVGADCVPGHGHADTLSLECSWRGRRLIVDPGSYAYDDDARRRYDRSTAAHNTVCIDGEDSSEVWHIFRVGRRATPRDVSARFASDGFEATAAHDGYRGLAGGPRHRRSLSVDGSGRLALVDVLEGGGRHSASGGLLLDPAWEAEPSGEGWLLRCGEERLRVAVQGHGGRLRLETGEAAYHPDYGVEVTTRRLTWRSEDAFPYEVRTEIESA
jgi:uncharacterized heparinase superfamily protein